LVRHQRDRKVSQKELPKIDKETHGRNANWETQTVGGGIVYVQPDVSIKRDESYKTKKGIVGEDDDDTMRGGSLTRFRTDEWYDQRGQNGKGLVTDVLRGGLQGLKRSRNPLKLPSHTVRGLKGGLSRGVKRKAEDVIKKEITKRAKKALSNKNVKEAVRVASALFPKQVKRARDIFGV